MRYGWRALGLFGAGALFGLVASAVLYAPPELGNQPPPWDHWARDQGHGAAATRVAAAPEAMAAASNPAAVVPSAVTVGPDVAAAGVPLVAASALPVAKVVAASNPPAAKKRKVQREEPAVDTATVGAGPAPEPISVAPEAIRQPPEDSLPRSEGLDPSR